MPELLWSFDVPVSADARTFRARACGAARADGKWIGWVEFVSLEDGRVLRTARETTQPNRDDVFYWATGLSRVYLEGALSRALAGEPSSPSLPTL